MYADVIRLGCEAFAGFYDCRRRQHSNSAALALSARARQRVLLQTGDVWPASSAGDARWCQSLGWWCFTVGGWAGSLMAWRRCTPLCRRTILTSPSLHLRIVRLLTRTDRDLREVRPAAYWTPALPLPSPPPLDRTKTSFTRSYSSGKLSGQ